MCGVVEDAYELWISAERNKKHYTMLTLINPIHSTI